MPENKKKVITPTMANNTTEKPTETNKQISIHLINPNRRRDVRVYKPRIYRYIAYIQTILVEKQKKQRGRTKSGFLMFVLMFVKYHNCVVLHPSKTWKILIRKSPKGLLVFLISMKNFPFFSKCFL